jgi:hypothetical protein
VGNLYSWYVTNHGLCWLMIALILIIMHDGDGGADDDFYKPMTLSHIYDVDYFPL